jgi:hypothetical protein
MSLDVDALKRLRRIFYDRKLSRFTHHPTAGLLILSEKSQSKTNNVLNNGKILIQAEGYSLLFVPRSPDDYEEGKSNPILYFNWNHLRLCSEKKFQRIAALETFYNEQKASAKSGDGIDLFEFIDKTKECIDLIATGLPNMLRPKKYRVDRYSFDEKCLNYGYQASIRIQNSNVEFDDVILCDVQDFVENADSMPETFLIYAGNLMYSLCINKKMLCDDYDLETEMLFRSWDCIYCNKYWEL